MTVRSRSRRRRGGDISCTAAPTANRKDNQGKCICGDKPAIGPFARGCKTFFKDFSVKGSNYRIVDSCPPRLPNTVPCLSDFKVYSVNADGSCDTTRLVHHPTILAAAKSAMDRFKSAAYQPHCPKPVPETPAASRDAAYHAPVEDDDGEGHFHMASMTPEEAANARKMVSGSDYGGGRRRRRRTKRRSRSKRSRSKRSRARKTKRRSRTRRRRRT